MSRATELARNNGWINNRIDAYNLELFYAAAREDGLRAAAEVCSAWLAAVSTPDGCSATLECRAAILALLPK